MLGQSTEGRESQALKQRLDSQGQNAGGRWTRAGTLSHRAGAPGHGVQLRSSVPACVARGPGGDAIRPGIGRNPSAPAASAGHSLGRGSAAGGQAGSCQGCQIRGSALSQSFMPKPLPPLPTWAAYTAPRSQDSRGSQRGPSYTAPAWGWCGRFRNVPPHPQARVCTHLAPRPPRCRSPRPAPGRPSSRSCMGPWPSPSCPASWTGAVPE